MSKQEATLQKMNTAYTTVSNFRREVSALEQQHRAALEEVKQHVSNVDLQREQYKQVRKEVRNHYVTFFLHEYLSKKDYFFSIIRSLSIHFHGHAHIFQLSYYI